MEVQPSVLIGLMQALPEVLVNLHGSWVIFDAHLRGSGKRITDLPLKFRCISEFSAPVSERFGVCLAEFQSSESMYRWLPEVKRVAVEKKLSIMEAGRLWSIQGRTWDARTRWLVAGDYGSRDEAATAVNEWTRVLESAFPMDRNLFWCRIESLSTTPPDPSGVIEVMVGDERRRDAEFRLEPLEEKSYASIYHVTIGKEFHWEHRKTLRFSGSLILLADHSRGLTPQQGGITVINQLPIETYLESVASSEATTGAADEYLKAQAVAARSTVLATVSRHHRADPFDLCAGDHCQCYYGIDQVNSRISSVVQSTKGLVRVMDHRPADCRYAKICGGKSETYPEVWGGEPIPYLMSKPCGGSKGKEFADWEEFLDVNYPSMCNPRLHRYPTTLESSRSLFRWVQEWKADALSEQVETILGSSVGKVKELVPVTRGNSGRINRLLLVGSEGKIPVRGELAIRKLLSESHLPSSLFVVETEGKRPDLFRLHGGGWGHGVGMCQLGGMAMARSGASFEKILDMYYPGTATEKLW